MKAICTPPTLVVILLTGLLAFTQPAIAYTIRYVQPGATGTGASWSDASGDLQGMINASQSGDLVWVAAGAYQPAAGTTFIMKSGVKIYGSFAGTETALTQRDIPLHTSELYPSDAGVVIQNDNNNLSTNSVLDGFYISGATNSAVRNIKSSPAFNNCTFTNNSTTLSGGAMYNYQCSPELTNCFFGYNTAQFGGGGLYISSGVTKLTNCTFIGNTATNSGGGGVVELDATATSAFTGCTFIDNKAKAGGGGLYSYNCNNVFTGCVFKGNAATATYGGGGLFTSGTSLFVNCLITGNFSAAKGGGYLHNTGTCTITNCTISGNRSLQNGGAIYTVAGADPVIRNSIIFNNSSGMVNANGITAAITNSLVQGFTATTNGNISGATNPTFVNPLMPGQNPGGDYRLQPCSPAINTGSSSVYTANNANLNADVDGATRIQGAAIDMGAYEYTGSGGNPTGADLLGINADQVYNTISGSTAFIAANSACRLIATLQPAGSTNALSGQVMAKVYIETTQPADFVKRHYEIAPPINYSCQATGRATLYFTQAEFNDFNAVNNIKLPTNPTDAAGKANLAIRQYTGTFFAGLCTSPYKTGPVIINPADNAIVWNSALNRWEVSVDFTGAGAFYVIAQSSPLPLTLLNFSGQPYSGYNQLQWQTADEANTKQFELERSSDGSAFTKTATIAAAGTGNNSYSYKDPASVNGKLYYRLKMVDIDGKFTYSSTVIITNSGTSTASLYPNPTNDVMYLQTGNELLNSTARLYDGNGQLLQSIPVTAAIQSIPVQQLKSGLYIIKLKNGAAMKFIKK
jgi:predicted outer membrane repeat protein